MADVAVRDVTAPENRVPPREQPCVAQYLYLHQPGEQFSYPSSRSSGSAARLGERYLECVLVQAASLRWSAPDCELLLVSNLTSRDSLTRRGRALLERILAFDVELLVADYRHAPREPVSKFHSACYVLDAIDAITPRLEPDRQLWLVDVDCLWLDPQLAFAAVAGLGGIGTLQIGYPPDWNVLGYTREDMGRLGGRLGPCMAVPPWIGGEILAGTASELRRTVEVCEELERELAGLDTSLHTEEQLLTVAGGLGRLELHSLSAVAGRIWTGRRHGASNPANPESLAVWHVPSEKGLSLRRAANALLRGRTERLRRDLSSPSRAAARFNVSAGRWWWRLRDDIWIAYSRIRDAATVRISRD